MTGQRLQFTRCPFGLHNSPAAMLTILTSIFAGQGQANKTWTYMDDIVTVGSSWGQNLHNLRAMLQTL